MASRLQDVILRGLAASKPLATTVAPGTLYYSTDAGTTERSSGTAWESYTDTGGGGGGGPHATTHSSAGTDPVDVKNLGGYPGGTTSFLRADHTFAIPASTPTAHATSHQPGGSDPMAVDSAAGVGSLRTLGTSSTSAAAGNDARLSDTRVPTAHATTHKSGGSDVIKLDELGAPTDVTTLNATTSAHGLLQKLPGGTTTFLRADGAFATPSATPSAHATTHSSGGSDPVTVTNLAGFPGGTANFLRADGTFAAPPTDTAHATTHQPGGSDPMAVDAAAATGSLRTLGTSSTSAAAGNDARFTDARTPTAHATSHKSGGSDSIKLDELAAPTDITTLNASTTAHGLQPKLPGTTTTFLRGDGTYAALPARTGAISLIIDGAGSVITTGLKAYLEIPFACTIQAVTLLADVSGSIVVDIWKDTYANYPPVVGDSITASAKPTITTALKSQDTTLTGWTTSVSAGDILAFNVNSVTTVTKVTLSLKISV